MMAFCRVHGSVKLKGPKDPTIRYLGLGSIYTFLSSTPLRFFWVPLVNTE